jgi:hypothetical protein
MQTLSPQQLTYVRHVAAALKERLLYGGVSRMSWWLICIWMVARPTHNTPIT